MKNALGGITVHILRQHAARAALAGLLALATANVPAQETTEGPLAETEPAADTIIVLPEVVVTATRDPDAPDRLPYSTSALSSEDIRVRRDPRSLPEVLEQQPGIRVQETSPGLQSPFLRGFTGFRTLLLVDGIRLNNAVLRDGPNQYWGTVDPLAIDRIEAVLGPSSVLYGSDAIGGTVNALTPTELEPGVHPGAYYRYASAERSHTTRADVRGRDGHIGYVAGVSWRDRGDIDGGRHVGEQENTGYSALSGDAKIMYDLSERVRLTVAHQVWDQDRVPRTHSTDESISWRGSSLGNNRRRDLYQERLFTYGRVEWRPLPEWIESTTFTLSHQRQREREERIRSDGRRTRQGFTDDTIGVGVAATTPTRAGRWTWGAEYYLDYVDSFRSDFNADGTLRQRFDRGPVSDDSLYGQLGVFIQDRWTPAEWVEVTVGGRYTLVHAGADADDIDPDPGDAAQFDDLDDTWHSLVGSARVIFHPYEWLSPFLGVSQGFRAPNLSDLTRFDAAQSNVIEKPNTDLDPEYFTTYEVGSHFRGETWRVSGAYFYTDVRDLIVRFQTGNVVDGLDEVEKDNIGDGYVYGVDLGVEWDFKRVDDVGTFTAFGNVSFVESRVDQINGDGEEEPAPMSKGPPTALLIGLRWTNAVRSAWLEATYEHVFKQDRLSFDDRNDTQRIPPGGTPGYGLVGLRGSWSVHERLRLFAGVENLGNVDYRAHGSGSNGPGTNVSAGLEARW